ncbi:DUF6732 family protein [Celeribacter marinus]|uniref:DUF6732 family protein n=1 Tax=Celeribacter marinus TaxID=1397108 RepID=UPI003F6BC319
MIRVLAFFFALFASPTFAHVGHITDVAGHDHWVAGIALGIAVGVAAWGAIKGAKEDKAQAEDASETDGHVDAEPQEA